MSRAGGAPGAGPPPKVIRARLGNCATADGEAALRARHPDVAAFHADPGAALLVIARRA